MHSAATAVVLSASTSVAALVVRVASTSVASVVVCFAFSEAIAVVPSASTSVVSLVVCFAATAVCSDCCLEISVTSGHFQRKREFAPQHAVCFVVHERRECI